MQALRRSLHSGRSALRESFASKGRPRAMLAAHSRLVDATLRRAWRALAVPREAALLAVGGFGRGELFPHSDVDILVLLPPAPAPALQSKVEEIIARLWDLGLEVGHSARTVAQCAEEAERDVTVRTALLEARLIVGSRSLYRSFSDGTRGRLERQAFFEAKQLEQEQRHARYQDSPYSLEPNVKDSPGGLRDLQTLRWIAQACQFGRSWADLAARGFMTAGEAAEAARRERFLQGLRIRMHYAAGRREDRLLFDFQDMLARQMGFQPTLAKRPSEQLMQVYYRTAKAVTQLSTILSQNLAVALFPESQAQAQPLNERFCMARELLDVRSEDLFEREPRAILESFLLMQRHTELKGMSARTLRALWHARARMDARFRRDPVNRSNFLALLQQPRGIVHELRRMNQYGILGRYLPVFRRIVGQMQHDLFHVYTVDQHILTVVRNLRRFTMMEHAHEYPFCSGLMAGFDKPWLLYVAAIFHDIAKGRGGDHSVLGKAEARRFCRRHDVQPEDAGLVEFLVEHHLTMSAIAQKQDLSDPEVIRRFVETVQSERRLVALYLLTVADIRGTSPKVWNAWKGKLLEDLFRAAHRLIRGEALGSDQDIRAKQAEALRLLQLYGLSEGAQQALWSRLDVAYFIRHDAQDIAWQTRLLHYRADTQAPVVKARLSPAGEGLQVMIYTRDRPKLFAHICGCFGTIGFNIADARIHTTLHGYALDTFQVLGTGTVTHYRDMIALIEHELAGALAPDAPLPPPVRGRISRQLKHFPIQPEVHIRPDERGQYHLLSVVAGDRPGLLYNIARVLADCGIDLHTAKIATLGERAEDVFVVSGAALSNPREVLTLEQELLEILHA
ncbi:MAG: [protein-PII] uridylyltransferase [Burkholderiales bacterium]|nr:[protein-PII] uridylyltransferase [Burkholderiales bacterium]